MAARRESPDSSSRASAQVEVEALMRVSKVVAAVIAHSLSVTDAKVTLPQLRILVMVQDSGPLNMSSVAEGLGVNPSNASRTCDRLVRGGLLDRRDDPSDRRNVVLTLTPAGQQLVDAMLSQREAVFARVVAHMGPRGRSQLTYGLTAFSDAARELSTEDTALPDGEGHLLRWLS